MQTHTIEFCLPVTIVIIPDMLVTILITKLSIPCLDVMTCQTRLAGMKVSITGTQNSHVLQKQMKTDPPCTFHLIGSQYTSISPGIMWLDLEKKCNKRFLYRIIFHKVPQAPEQIQTNLPCGTF